MAKCVMFKMRYAATFNNFTANSVVLFFMILFPWQTVIQKAIAKHIKRCLRLKKENQPMKRMFVILQSNTLIF